MKIGDLPAATTAASGDLVPFESGGATKKITALNLVKSVFASAANLTIVNTLSRLFSSYDGTTATVTSAQCSRTGRLYNLDFVAKLNRDLEVNALGGLSYYDIATIATDFRPQSTPNDMVFGTVWSSVLGRNGVAVIFPTQGAIQIRHMDGNGGTYTLASGSTLYFSFMYLR